MSGNALDSSTIRRNVNKMMGILETKSESSRVSQEWTCLSDVPATFIISWEPPMGNLAPGQTQGWVSEDGS